MIENVLRVWRMRDLTIQGKIVIFKSLAISKIVHLALIKSVPIFTIEQLNVIKKNFIWKEKSRTKAKHSALCNSYENGGLKDVDILYKIISIQCSWIRRLFNENFHDWKVILLFLIKKNFGENFKFHGNVDIPKCSLNNFPCFYKKILTQQSKYLSFSVSLPSAITSQFLWFNKYIIGDRKCIYFKDFSKKGLNFVGKLFDLEGKLKNWTAIKNKYHLLESKSFQWMQLVDVFMTTILLEKTKFFLLVNLTGRN